MTLLSQGVICYSSTAAYNLNLTTLGRQLLLFQQPVLLTLGAAEDTCNFLQGPEGKEGVPKYLSGEKMTVNQAPLIVQMIYCVTGTGMQLDYRVTQQYGLCGPCWFSPSDRRDSDYTVEPVPEQPCCRS